MWPRALALGVAVAACGCASRKQAGEALVAAGTTAVMVGASSGSTYCNRNGCYSPSRKRSTAGAVIAGAGAAAAVAGVVLIESDRKDAASRPRSDPDPGDPRVVPATYRLPRRQVPAPEPSLSEERAGEQPAPEPSLSEERAGEQ